MRALMWFLLLFALAVLLALLMGGNQPVVTIFWPPDKAIDFSLNFAALALVALFLLVQMLLRASSLLRQLPQQARRWRMRQREQAMHGNLLDAMSHYIAGRFVRARKSAQQALDQEAERQEGVTGALEGEQLPYRAQLRALYQ